MDVIELKHIRKRYTHDHYVIKDLSVVIKEKEFIVLLGPSGCGKSTTLRIIAGLEDISEGDLFLNGRWVNDTPSKDRNISMVFQNYALFPHLNVYDNIAFTLNIQKKNKNLIKERVDKAVELLALEDYLDRKPGDLSGGQQQRVALGRAIVNQSDFFLMDEPLSNLDANLRTIMREEIIKLHRHLETTTVYVTHDQTEAMTMADRIVILNNGVIQQIGTPEEIYDKPANVFVADFIGSPKMNLCPGYIRQGKLLLLDKYPIAQVTDTYCEDQPVTIGIRPHHFLMDSNGLPLKVTFSEMMGAEIHYQTELDYQIFKIKVDRIGDDTTRNLLNVRPMVKHLHLFDSKTQVALPIQLEAIHEL